MAYINQGRSTSAPPHTLCPGKANNNKQHVKKLLYYTRDQQTYKLKLNEWMHIKKIFGRNILKIKQLTVGGYFSFLMILWPKYIFDLPYLRHMARDSKAVIHF